MTDCNSNQLLFASLGRKKIQADFNGGSRTSDAGALPLASPPTLCRLVLRSEALLRRVALENRVDGKALTEIAKVFVEAFIGSYTKEPDLLILDFDATDDPVHGNQHLKLLVDRIRQVWPNVRIIFRCGLYSDGHASQRRSCQ